MKLIQQFNSFLDNTVNLDPPRVERARDGLRVIDSFLKNNETFKDSILSTSPQGSIRQKTVIKPVEGGEYDIDILVELEESVEWDPRTYLNALHQEFKKSPRYADKVDRVGKSRCVTIDYESDFHIDIIPSITINGVAYIMNKNTNEFEITDADGYAQWFAAKNQITPDDGLIKAIRLIKYLRDIKGTFSVKSVLLTTILAGQVNDFDDPKLFSDVPTALKTILNRLNEFLESNPVMPIITNPALPAENFNRHWDDDKYQNFRSKIALYNDRVNEAYNSETEAESIKRWRAVFGDEFPDIEGGDVTVLVQNPVLSLASYDHRETPPWPEHIKYAVSIKAYAKSKNKINIGEIQSDTGLLSEGYQIDYMATTNTPDPYDVYWQVVNTGPHAASVQGGLRGEIRPAKDTSRPLHQDERTEYTGKHWIECYIVQNGICVAKSSPFFIRVANQTHPRFKLRRR